MDFKKHREMYDIAGKVTHKSNYCANAISEASEALALDTLAQLGTEPNSLGIEGLKKRARAKYFTSHLSVKLATLDSPLKKSYWNSYHCAGAVEQKGKTFTSHYCNNRWCSVCNRIRTAKLIKGYQKPLSELNDAQFVTLTIPNVPAADLRGTITLMQKQIKAISETFKRRHQRGSQDWQLVGIRKIECTYNYKTDEYHPHYHLIIEGKEASEQLVSEWLKRFQKADIKAQNIKPAIKGSEQELFKYFTKIVSKTGKGEYKTFVNALDVMFEAMRGFRVFQPIGLKKIVEEDIEELQSEDIEGVEEKRTIWLWSKNDWADYDTGEALTGYIPSEAMDELIKGMILKRNTS